MNNKTYLGELPSEDIKKMLNGDLYSYMYDIVANDNSEYAAYLIEEILGKDFDRWIKTDTTYHDWYINIKPGHYADTLDITEYDYFAIDDAERIKKLQKEIAKLKDKIENLDGDDMRYYDKINEWEDKADKLADEILQIVREEVKRAEEVTDDQIEEAFMNDFDIGQEFYIINNDKTRVYRDYTKSFRTCYKEGE